MKPSLYFADTFRFFFKRFLSQESLLRWFTNKAGNTSETFEYPFKLSNIQSVLVMLPEKSEDVLTYLPFLDTLEKYKSHACLVLSNIAHKNLLMSHGVKQEVFYYTTLGCRFGEKEFGRIETMLSARKISVSLCLEPEPRFQMLYLLKKSGATYRFGFDCEKYYPLLNLSLVADGNSQKQSTFLTALFNGAAK